MKLNLFRHSFTNDQISVATEAVTIFVVIAVTLTLIVIGVPPIRDGLLIRLSQQRRDWLITHKSNLIPWIDWCRIVFEIALALFISNQVFNEHIRTFFENSLDRLKRSLTLRIEKSVERDDARVKIKQAIQEMIVFMYLPARIRDVPSDAKILFDASYTIYSEVRRAIPFLFIRLVGLRVLNAFSGKLHGTFALLAFWEVVVMKVARLYLDSTILSGSMPK